MNGNNGHSPRFFFTKKELAAAIGRNPRFIRDMELGGFRLPATVEDAVVFIRENQWPTRFRNSRPKSKK